MQKLLTKTLRSFTIYALIVLAASIPVYYFVVDAIWKDELDEHNEIIADGVVAGFNNLKINDTAFEKNIDLWNNIQANAKLQETEQNTTKPDSIYIIEKPKPHSADKSIHRFRVLAKNVVIKNKTYRIIVETNIEETHETVLAIALITIAFFILLVIGFIILNKKLSDKLWLPFRNTLARLKTFNLSGEKNIDFENTTIYEFEELNNVLKKLIDKNIVTFRSQKEFTENASHELQTPLAIIKNKLDILLQKENLTDRQYQIIEEINIALTRSTRINKNLLLLTRIETHQYDTTETINISTALTECIERLHEYAANKFITISHEIKPDIFTKGNLTLTEILINNLLLNAIRHNQQNGTINISLTAQQLTIANSGNKPLNDEKIFQRFGKVNSESAGTGLGLSIIQEICKRQNWNIHYTFKENRHLFTIQF